MSDVSAISNMLRERAVAAFRDKEVSEEQLAASLNIFPMAVSRLMSESSWTVDRAIRVLDALGEDVHLA